MSVIDTLESASDQPEPKRSHMGLVVNAALIALAFGLLALVLNQNRDKILEILGGKLDYRLLIFGILVFQSSVILTFFRWYALVRVIEPRFTLRGTLLLGFIGYVFNLVIPGAVGGDLIKAAYLVRMHIRKTQAVASMVIDRILGLLVEDGRRSASELGRQVGLSPAAAKRRIDRLEQIGVIGGYRAVLDHARLGSQIEAFIELRFAGATQVDDIERAVAKLPEVIEAFTTAGDPDALVRVRATDLDHLKRVVDRIRRTGKVTGTKTLIVLGSTGPGA